MVDDPCSSEDDGRWDKTRPNRRDEGQNGRRLRRRARRLREISDGFREELFLVAFGGRLTARKGHDGGGAGPTCSATVRVQRLRWRVHASGRRKVVRRVGRSAVDYRLCGAQLRSPSRGRSLLAGPPVAAVIAFVHTYPAAAAAARPRYVRAAAPAVRPRLVSPLTRGK